MSKILFHLPALCNIVKRIASEAGDITLDYFDEGAYIAHDDKKDGSPITDADRRAEEFIAKALKEELPDIPVVGEESVSNGDVNEVKGHEYFWLVDPLDGTKEFIEGSPDFTVNIALIKNNVPILGVICAPARGEIFSAFGEGTAMRWSAEGDKEKSISVRKPTRHGLVVITSRNRAQEQIAKYLEEQKVEKIIRCGSSLKICAVAAGKADLYPGFGQTSEWDTAAGQAILTSAGGEIVTLDGRPLTYGDKDGHFNNPQFLARSKYLAEGEA